ncbi:putative serine/threonine-protein kinase [Aphelenchoides bicaudatus]|nr:putative serine/threonine-protein kinase [Aphelenchoides bicaudatus]
MIETESTSHSRDGHSQEDIHKDERRNGSKSPLIKKNPRIQAPSPDRNDTHRHNDRKRRHDPKFRHSDNDLAKKSPKIVVEERIEIVSVNLKPDNNAGISPKPKSPINPILKSLSTPQQPRSNTSSPLPGSKKYSRFDSRESESEGEIDHPIEMHASPEISDDEHENMDVHEPENVDENQTSLQTKPFDELTEEEKGTMSPDKLKKKEEEYQKYLISKLPVYYPGISGCRSVDEFKILNRIDEGTFGVVYRAMETRTDEVVALKRLKMEKEHEGFPITSLREINMLMKCRNHPNVLKLREIVVGSNMDKIYLVMEYVEHDVKALLKQMEERKKKFRIAEVKTLMQQLLSGCAYMHDEWVIHRDLKTSNLLLSHNNILKIGDFGLAREYGDPLKNYTPIVVTLWYRSPELLLGDKLYSTAVDVWSIGCIFGEFLRLKPIFPGTSEIEQLNRIFAETGTPNDKIWPGYSELPGVKKWILPPNKTNQLRTKYMPDLKSEAALELMQQLLTLDPNRRISCNAALKHQFFTEDPKPASPDSFPTWPAKSEGFKPPPKQNQPKAEPQIEVDPERLKLFKELNIKPTKAALNAGFSLKLGR